MADTGSAVLATVEFDFVLEELRRSCGELLRILPPQGSSLWNQRDGEGRWSVAEVVEHLIIVETLLQQSLPEAVAAGPRPDWESVQVTPVETLRQFRVTGERRVEAPPHLHPAVAAQPGDHASRFQRTREETIAWAAPLRDQPLRAILPPPNRTLGQLNLAQYLLAIAWHTDRHTLQISGCLAP